MNFGKYRVLFISIIAIVALLVASPALSRLLVYPRTQFFTEFWILGPNHKADNYPYNITRGQNYTVSLEVANRLGYAAYYQVEVKFRNSSESAPYDNDSSSIHVPSSLPSLYNISAIVPDEGTWEEPLVFSFDYINTTSSTLQMTSLTLNNVQLNLTDQSISWFPQARTFSGYLFFELWIYNSTASVFQYHGRELSLALNMTA